MTKKQLKKLAINEKNNFKKFVYSELLELSSDYSDISELLDSISYGLDSGVVPGLIYNDDINLVFYKYEGDIEEIIFNDETIKDSILGDPKSFQEIRTKSVWYAFETVCRSLA